MCSYGACSVRAAVLLIVTIGAGSRLQNVPAELFSDVFHFPHMSTFRFGQLPIIWQAAPLVNFASW